MFAASTPPAIVSQVTAPTTCPNGLPASRAAGALRVAEAAWPADGSSHVIGVLVTVQLDASGHVTKAVVSGYRPSSDTAEMQKRFDDAAIAAAEASTYEPAVANCVAVPGKFVVAFSNARLVPCPDGLPSLREAVATRVAAPRGPHSANGAMTIDLIIDIDENGNVTGAHPIAEAPKEFADAAIAAAKASKFMPKIENCKPVSSEYVFRVTM